MQTETSDNNSNFLTWRDITFRYSKEFDWNCTVEYLSIEKGEMKEKEEKKFQEDIAALSNELATLDEGKYQSMLKSSPPFPFFLLTPSENRSMTHTLLSLSLFLARKA